VAGLDRFASCGVVLVQHIEVGAKRLDGSLHVVDLFFIVLWQKPLELLLQI
jgi:hypothetical protein